MQSRISTDRHISATEIIVDRAHHPDDVEVAALLCLIIINAACACHSGGNTYILRR